MPFSLHCEQKDKSFFLPHWTLLNFIRIENRSEKKNDFRKVIQFNRNESSWFGLVVFFDPKFFISVCSAISITPSYSMNNVSLFDFVFFVVYSYFRIVALWWWYGQRMQKKEIRFTDCLTCLYLRDVHSSICNINWFNQLVGFDYYSVCAFGWIHFCHFRINESPFPILNRKFWIQSLFSMEKKSLEWPFVIESECTVAMDLKYDNGDGDSWLRCNLLFFLFFFFFNSCFLSKKFSF